MRSEDETFGHRMHLFIFWHSSKYITYLRFSNRLSEEIHKNGEILKSATEINSRLNHTSDKLTVGTLIVLNSAIWMLLCVFFCTKFAMVVLIVYPPDIESTRARFSHRTFPGQSIKSSQGTASYFCTLCRKKFILARLWSKFWNHSSPLPGTS